MSRKHFELIARTLRESNAPWNVVYAFACNLALTNPNFDRKRFLIAAYGSDGTEEPAPKQES